MILAKENDFDALLATEAERMIDFSSSFSVRAPAIVWTIRRRRGPRAVGLRRVRDVGSIATRSLIICVHGRLWHVPAICWVSSVI